MIEGNVVMEWESRSPKEVYDSLMKTYSKEELAQQVAALIVENQNLIKLLQKEGINYGIKL